MTGVYGMFRLSEQRLKVHFPEQSVVVDRMPVLRDSALPAPVAKDVGANWGQVFAFNPLPRSNWEDSPPVSTLTVTQPRRGLVRKQPQEPSALFGSRTHDGCSSPRTVHRVFLPASNSTAPRTLQEPHLACRFYLPSNEGQ